MGRDQTASRSGDAECAGWLYRPDAAGHSLACVVLGHGFGALKEARNQVSARAVLRVGTYSPGRRAAAVGCPLLVQIVTEDAVTPTGPAVRAAEHAPRGELRSYPGAPFEIYLGELFERAVSDQVDFLERRL